MKPVERTIKPIYPNNPPGDVPPQKRLLSRAASVVRTEKNSVKPNYPNNPPGDVPPQKRLKSYPTPRLNLQEDMPLNNCTQVTSDTTLSNSQPEIVYNV